MYQTSWLCLLLGCILFAACSKDDVNDALAPKITLSSSTSIYTGKVNRDIVLEATVERNRSVFSARTKRASITLR